MNGSNKKSENLELHTLLRFAITHVAKGMMMIITNARLSKYDDGSYWLHVHTEGNARSASLNLSNASASGLEKKAFQE